MGFNSAFKGLNIKNVLWRVAKCPSYIEEAQCLKVNLYRENNAIADLMNNMSI